MTENAKSVQRTIRWYAISAVLLTGFVIALVVMLPLQARLFDMQKQHVQFSRDASVLVIHSYFQRESKNPLTAFDRKNAAITIRKIQQLMNEKVHGYLGNVFIYRVQNHQLSWIFSNKKNSQQNLIGSWNNADVNSMLVNSVEQNKSGTLFKTIDHENFIISYTAIPDAPLGLVVVANKMDLYHAMQHAAFMLLLIVMLILFFFALGLAAVLRPLSNRTLLETHELELLVEQGREKLNELNKRLYRLAMIDSLTNALTRRAFYVRCKEELSRCKRYNRSFGLLFLDIDKFKAVNDTLGHDAGDFLLKELAHRITQMIREEDVLARLGGDEFALLLPEKNDFASLAIVMDRIKQCIAPPMKFKNHIFSCAVSIGAAIYPVDGEDIDELLKIADDRMYEEKNL
ncbi:MAG TPA: GGDEF domain-containing protein [Coxiellaceae bacterium]|nr:MAG: hypothetical protein A3E81_06800 [Gammaproteobacteria bacterium RIFCSPHIGHO2_12_FULL_36_30]HLB56465.1 GGDEF domain-containing protein [Coxiellaceae bacterium]